jgi:hypothetical protein
MVTNPGCRNSPFAEGRAPLNFGFGISRARFHAAAVFQIVFNEISAAEISRLGTLEQLELLDEFKVSENDLDHLDGERFGRIERDGRTLHRFRAKDWRFYFEVKDGVVIVHRVLHKGTFSDFAFRSKIPIAEDEELAKSKHFWKLIDEGRAARRL